MKWAFVDYENIGSLGKIDLSSYERVIVFLGANQPRLDFNDTKYDKPINLVVIQIKGTQDNNLDFHLAYYLGEMNTLAPQEVTFEVVSNDNGFLPLVAHIKNSGRHCTRKNVGLLEVTETEALIRNLTSKPKDKRPKSVTSLCNYISAYLKLKENSNAISRQLNQLVLEKVVKVSGSNIMYLY